LKVVGFVKMTALIDEIEKILWKTHYGDGSGNCFICEDKVEYEDFRAVKIFPSGPYKVENLKIFCISCKRSLNPREGALHFQVRFKDTPELQERKRLRLVAQEKIAREEEIYNLREAMDNNIQKIRDLENENAANRLKINHLKDSFCEKLVRGKLCKSTNCEHMSPPKYHEVTVKTYIYENFSFENINSDCLLITQPLKFRGYVVSPHYPHQVYFKLFDSPHFTLYTKEKSSELLSIGGFKDASAVEIVEKYNLSLYSEYRETSINFLRSYFMKIKVATIETKFEEKRNFTQVFQELKGMTSNMKTKRHQARPVSIPIVLERELEKLRIQ